MNRILALFILCLAASIPSFGSEHILTRSAKAIGHGSYKVTKGVGHATVSAVKFIF